VTLVGGTGIEPVASSVSHLTKVLLTVLCAWLTYSWQAARPLGCMATLLSVLLSVRPPPERWELHIAWRASARRGEYGPVTRRLPHPGPVRRGREPSGYPDCSLSARLQFVKEVEEAVASLADDGSITLYRGDWETAAPRFRRRHLPDEQLGQRRGTGGGRLWPGRLDRSGAGS
jgi:hypothetical protein